MPLEIILPIVVFGITGIVLLVHFVGWTQHRQIPDKALAQTIWQADFPGEVIANLAIDDTGLCALVTLTDGRKGLIWSFGDDAVARHLDVAPSVEATPTGLHLRLADFTAPVVKLTLSDNTIKTDWAKTLAAI